MELELDMKTDILEFSPKPPRRRLLDFVPSWLLHFPRTWFGWPKATPYETWVVALHIVKMMLDDYIQTEAARQDPFFSEAPPSYNPDIPPENLN